MQPPPTTPLTTVDFAIWETVVSEMPEDSRGMIVQRGADSKLGRAIIHQFKQQPTDHPLE